MTDISAQKTLPDKISKTTYTKRSAVNSALFKYHEVEIPSLSKGLKSKIVKSRIRNGSGSANRSYITVINYSETEAIIDSTIYSCKNGSYQDSTIEERFTYNYVGNLLFTRTKLVYESGSKALRRKHLVSHGYNKKGSIHTAIKTLVWSKYSNKKNQSDTTKVIESNNGGTTKILTNSWKYIYTNLTFNEGGYLIELNNIDSSKYRTGITKQNCVYNTNELLIRCSIIEKHSAEEGLPTKMNKISDLKYEYWDESTLKSEEKVSDNGSMQLNYNQNGDLISRLTLTDTTNFTISRDTITENFGKTEILKSVSESGIYSWINSFDKNDRILSASLKIKRGEKEKEFSKQLHTYDSKGHLVKLESYGSSGQLMRTYLYKYYPQ